MADSENAHIKTPAASVEEVQRGWHELNLRVGQLETERATLEHENKTLRLLLERVVEHRQKSHGELVLLLTSLVSKLPINDVGVVVAKLVEHNANVSEVCAALSKGTVGGALPLPSVLKDLDQTKRDLAAAIKPAVEELIQSEPSLEIEMLRSFVKDPELFFKPAAVRANRCFVKGQVTKERILREYGDAALVFFNDMTTDAKLNPRPKPDEIVLTFKSDFEALFQQNPGVLPEKRQQLMELFQRIQKSKTTTDAARAQKNAFQRMSFLLELLHYYTNQSTEAPDVIFALRLPVLIEQLVLGGGQETLDEKWLKQAEGLLAFIISHDHRLMVINNIGKSGGTAKTLKFILRLRVEKLTEENEVVHEFVRHLIPPQPQKPPTPQAIATVLRLLNHPDRQKLVVRGIMGTDRIQRVDAELLGRAVGVELGLTGLEQIAKEQSALSPEMERSLAWEKVKELIDNRADPAVIATAIRDRLHLKYDADEVRQSWVTFMEAEPISFIRAFCQLPYLADGRTDPIARAVLETYVTRLTHEKYAATYAKVMNSLKNMYKAKPDSPTLLNFIALVKWVDADSATKLSRDIGLPA